MHDLSHHSGSSLGTDLSHRARFLRRGSAVLVTLLVLSGLSAAVAAAAGPPVAERYHEEGTFVDENFCGAGLMVDGTFVADGRLHVVPHGPDGLQYFLEHVKITVVYTNRANSKTVTLEVDPRQQGPESDRQRRRHADDSRACNRQRRLLRTGRQGDRAGTRVRSESRSSSRTTTVARRPIRPTTRFSPMGSSSRARPGGATTSAKPQCPH